MSEIEYKTVALKDIIDFDNCKTNGSEFTKTFVNQNKGNIPVYGASKEEDEIGYGYVKDNLSIKKGNRNIPVKYFENCLTWNIDGSMALFYRRGRFSLSEKVIPLILYEEFAKTIDLEYLKIFISQSAEIKDFHFSNKAGKEKLKNISIQIPINEFKEYDLMAQKKIVEKYHNIEKRQKTLLDKKNTLMTSIVGDNLLKHCLCKEELLIKLFKPQRGNSKYTKTLCQKNNGEYPVYSANNNTPLGYADFYDYNGEYLTVSVNGIAGKITPIKGKFSINADRIILVPLSEDKIDINFIKYTVEPVLRSKIKGRMGYDGQNEFTKLPSGIIDKIKINIPINSKGEYDIEKQKEIALKYRKIDEIKKAIANQIDSLCSVEIKL